MNNLLSRLKKVEQTVKQKKSVVRFIEKIGNEFVITQSTYKTEINTRLKDLTDIEKLNNAGNTINFIELINY